MWQGTATDLGDGGELKRPTTSFEGTETFGPAEPMTVRLRGVNVTEDADPLLRGENDLIVVTKTQFNAEPPVQRVHYFEREVETGYHDDFFRDNVLSVRDLEDPHNDSLNLRIQVYDVDGVSPALIDAVKELAPAASVVFPDLSGVAQTAAMNAPRFLKLVDTLDNHDELLEDRITLEVAQPDHGQDLLQPGYLVAFGDRPGEVELRNDTRVYTTDGSPYDGTYAVLQVQREFQASREQVIDQKVAKLMAEINDKGQNKGKAALDFLTETLKSDDDYERLARARELAAKDDLTDAERERLDELRSDPALAPYLQGLDDG